MKNQVKICCLLEKGQTIHGRPRPPVGPHHVAMRIKGDSKLHRFNRSLRLEFLKFLTSLCNNQALVVQTLDSAIHRIKIHSLDKAIGFLNTYPLDSDLSSGYSAIQRLNNRGLKNKSYLLLCLQRFLFLMQSLFCSLPNFPHPSPLPHPAIGGMIVWRFGLFTINKKIRKGRVVYYVPKISGLWRRARLDSSYNMKLVRNLRNL